MQQRTTARIFCRPTIVFSKHGYVLDATWPPNNYVYRFLSRSYKPVLLVSACITVLPAFIYHWLKSLNTGNMLDIWPTLDCSVRLSSYRYCPTTTVARMRTTFAAMTVFYRMLGHNMIRQTLLIRSGGSSAVECLASNRERPASNPLCYRFRSLDTLVLSTTL